MRPNIGYSTLYWINKDKKRLSKASNDCEKKLCEPEEDISIIEDSNDDDVSEEAYDNSSENVIVLPSNSENTNDSLTEAKPSSQPEETSALIFDDQTSLWTR